MWKQIVCNIWFKSANTACEKQKIINCRTGTLRSNFWRRKGLTQISAQFLLLALTRRNIITKEWNLPKSALKITVINGLNIVMTVLPNGLFSLSLANLWFLIPLGHDILKCSSNNGPLELLSSLGTFFGDIGFNTLIVFPSVENRPCHFSWISFEKMSTMTSTIQKFKHLNTNKKSWVLLTNFSGI